MLKPILDLVLFAQGEKSDLSTKISCFDQKGYIYIKGGGHTIGAGARGTLNLPSKLLTGNI